MKHRELVARFGALAIALVAGVTFCACVCAAEPAVSAIQVPIKPPKHGGVYVMAHRGAHQGIPENTLAAYQKAIDIGVDFVEIDLRTTKDGKHISCHNGSVDAYTSGALKGNVRDHTLAELRAVDIGSRVGPQFKGVTFPTFNEILDLCKGKVGIYLDFKDADIAEIAKILVDRGMQHEVVWYLNGDQVKQSKELHEVAPECIPMVDPGPEKNLAKLIEQTHPQIVASTLDDYSKTFVQTCHAAGAIVIVDVLPNDPRLWQQALDWGTDGLQTDYPAELVAWLDAHGKPAEKKP